MFLHSSNEGKKQGNRYRLRQELEFNSGHVNLSEVPVFLNRIRWVFLTKFQDQV